MVNLYELGFNLKQCEYLENLELKISKNHVGDLERINFLADKTEYIYEKMSKIYDRLGKIMDRLDSLEARL